MLLSAIPVVSAEEEALKPRSVHFQGEIPSPVNVPVGCSSNTRCPFAEGRCFTEDPVMTETRPEHFVRCHRTSRELVLKTPAKASMIEQERMQ